MAHKRKFSVRGDGGERFTFRLEVDSDGDVHVYCANGDGDEVDLCRFDAEDGTLELNNSLYEDFGLTLDEDGMGFIKVVWDLSRL